MCFVFIWEQTATCATYIINWSVFVTEMKSVYSAVRTESLNKAVWASSLTINSTVFLILFSNVRCPNKFKSVDSRNTWGTNLWRIVRPGSSVWTQREENCPVINRNEEAGFDAFPKGVAMTLVELAECEVNSRNPSQTSGPTTYFLMGYIKG